MNRKTRYCDAPITIAAYFGQHEAVAILLGGGADVSHITADNRTCESMLMERHKLKLPEPSVQGLGWTRSRHCFFSSSHKKVILLLFRMCTLSFDKMDLEFDVEYVDDEKNQYENASAALARRVPWVIWLEIIQYTYGGWFPPERTSKIVENKEMDISQ